MSRRFSFSQSSGQDTAVQPRRRSRSVDLAVQRKGTLSWARDALRQHASVFPGATDYFHGESYNLFLFPLVPHIRTDPKIAYPILDAWLTTPLLVPNTDLSRILRLEECTARSPVPASCAQGHITYFRSWELSKDQFRKIIEDLGRSNVVIHSDWRMALQRCSDGSTVTIRYIGTTRSPSTPWKRAKQRNERKGSLIGTFLGCIRRHAPESTTPRVFAIVGTFIPADGTHPLREKALQQIADGYERAFISFFKRKSLLNTQPGGKVANYGVEGSAELILIHCQTALLSRLDEHDLIQNDKVAEAVNRHFDNWFEYARQNIWHLNYPSPPQTYLDSVYTQAKSRQIKGISPAVICGYDPPQETLRDGATFFSGSRATSAFVLSTLSSIARLELGRRDISLRRLQAVIGFSQLFNLPRADLEKDGRLRAGALMDSWLGAVRPLIILPLGQDATAWMKSKRRRTPMNGIIHEAGRPRIVELPLEQPLRCIVIPHLHPGYVVRTEMSPALYEVATLSWVASWICMDTAVELLQSSQTFVSREFLVDATFNGTSSKLQKAGFYDAIFEAAKSASIPAGLVNSGLVVPENRDTEMLAKPRKRKRLLTRLLSTTPVTESTSTPNEVVSPSETTRSEYPSVLAFKTTSNFLKIFAQAELKFSSSDDETRFIAAVEHYGRARGEQQSDERAQQAKELFCKDVACYYRCEDFEKWQKAVLAQPRGFWLGGCLEAWRQSKSTGLDETSIRTGQNDANPPEFSKADTRLDRLEEALDLIMEEHTTWLQRRSRRGVSSKTLLVPLEQVDGSKVHINQRGKMSLRVQGLGGHEHCIGIGLGEGAVPVHEGDYRTISFSPRGVAVLSPQGTILSPRSNDLTLLGGNEDTLTLPLSRLRGLEGGKELLSVWKQIVNGALPEDTYSLTSGSFEKGRPVPKSVPSGPSSMLVPGDGLWLLNCFLDEHFPNGGDIWLGEKHFFPQGTDDVDRFTRFLDSRPYRQHPYAENWKNRIAERSPRNWIIPLRCLRKEVRSRSQNLSRTLHPQGRKGIKRTVINISAEKTEIFIE